MQLTEAQQAILIGLASYYQEKRPTKPPKASQLARYIYPQAPYHQLCSKRCSVANLLGILQRKHLVEGIEYSNGYSHYNRWELSPQGKALLGIEDL